MGTYRAYSIERDGHIVEPPVVIECSDDEQAIEAVASEVTDGKLRELWQGSRRVTVIAPAGAGAQRVDSR